MTSEVLQQKPPIGRRAIKAEIKAAAKYVVHDLKSAFVQGIAQPESLTPADWVRKLHSRASLYDLGHLYPGPAPIHPHTLGLVKGILPEHLKEFVRRLNREFAKSHRLWGLTAVIDDQPADRPPLDQVKIVGKQKVV